jgi:carbamoyltransferase
MTWITWFFNEKPLVKLERILMTTLDSYPRSWRLFGEAVIAWFDKKLWVKSALMQKLGIEAGKILFTDHHAAHAASAFFSSPFKEAAILTIDGVGEWTTATMGSGLASWEDGGVDEIILTDEQRFPHSLGLLYSAFTALLGFKVNSGEYKVMGMAPYGEPRYLDKIEKVFKVYPDGSFWVNMDYFC